MKRRTLLGAAGVTLSTALGGCMGERGVLGEPGDGSITPTEESETPTTREPTQSTDSPPDGGGVEVENIVVRKAVKYRSIMGSGGVLAVDGQQYVVASVPAGREFSESAFTFETEEESWNPGLPDTVGGYNSAVAGHEGRPFDHKYGANEQTYLAFAVPSPLTASNPRIRFGESGLEWALPNAEQRRLAAPAAHFELDSLEAPEEISRGDVQSVSLTATNVSETDGRFLAAVYWPTSIADDDESRIIEREVAAGEDVTASLDIETEHTHREGESVTLSIRGHVAGERTVLVRDTETTSS